MKTKCISLLITVLIFINLVGCEMKATNKEDVYQKFSEKVSKIKSYTCIAEVEVIGNKGRNSYILRHNYKNPNNYYLEVISPENLKGNIMEYKDNKIVIKNSKINDLIEFSNDEKAEQYLFVGDFINNFIKKDGIDTRLSDDKLILESEIPGDDEYFNKQILYIDIREKTPTNMEILDKEGNVKFKVTYKNFEYNK